MKKQFKFLSLLFCAVLIFGMLFGCEIAKPDGTPCTVTLVYNNGTDNFEAEAIAGETFTTPADPVKQNYIFTGWYLDADLTEKYDFSKKVKNDFTLFAGYVLDCASIATAITAKGIMKGAVEVVRVPYTIKSGFAVSKKQHDSANGSTGSGFCFLIESSSLETNYYFLTNCHVAYYDKNTYAGSDYTIIDWQGNEWSASLYTDNTLKGEAIDPAYDLAILTVNVKATDETTPEIIALDFDAEPKLKDDVIAIGSPLGQNNTVTFGKVTDYTIISVKADSDGDGTQDVTKNQSNVTFDVIRHTAYTNPGSSGGALINPDFKVVGVNYACSTDTKTGEFVASCSIPSNKVFEFLDAYFNKTI